MGPDILLLIFFPSLNSVSWIEVSGPALNNFVKQLDLPWKGDLYVGYLRIMIGHGRYIYIYYIYTLVCGSKWYLGPPK